MRQESLQQHPGNDEQEEALGLVLVILSKFIDSNWKRKKLERSAGIATFFIVPCLWSSVTVFMCYGE